MAQGADTFQAQGQQLAVGYGYPTGQRLPQGPACDNSEPERKPGVKLDAGKPKYFINVRWQFWRALEALAHHTEKGNNEPGHVPKGWTAVDNGYERYTEALERHLHEEAMRYGQHDERSRQELIEHATATLWNAAARLELLLADQEE